MSVTVDLSPNYEREQLALYLAALLPPDQKESERVIALMVDLVPVISKHRLQNDQPD